jgi:hypothetical protein
VPHRLEGIGIIGIIGIIGGFVLLGSPLSAALVEQMTSGLR